jgi:hypothetical protein
MHTVKIGFKDNDTGAIVRRHVASSEAVVHGMKRLNLSSFDIKYMTTGGKVATFLDNNGINLRLKWFDSMQLFELEDNRSESLPRTKIAMGDIGSIEYNGAVRQVIVRNSRPGEHPNRSRIEMALASRKLGKGDPVFIRFLCVEDCMDSVNFRADQYKVIHRIELKAVLLVAAIKKHGYHIG